MPSCDNCGAHVTAKYVQIFGRNGQLAACLHCNPRRELSDGGGVPEMTDGE
jgi:hypothetical protein